MSSVSFTLPGANLSDSEFTEGERLTEKDALAIVEASKDPETGKYRLHFDKEKGVITGSDHDGTGEVYIDINKPLPEGALHDLHHTVRGSGGNGNDGSPGPLNGGSNHHG